MEYLERLEMKKAIANALNKKKNGTEPENLKKVSSGHNNHKKG